MWVVNGHNTNEICNCSSIYNGCNRMLQTKNCFGCHFQSHSKRMQPLNPMEIFASTDFIRTMTCSLDIFDGKGCKAEQWNEDSLKEWFRIDPNFRNLLCSKKMYYLHPYNVRTIWMSRKQNSYSMTIDWKLMFLWWLISWNNNTFI